MTEPLPPPLQADSPAVLADGRLVPRYRPPAVGGGTFQVDLTNAPQAIRELEAAKAELLDIRREAEALGRVTPPSRDQVSLDAARVLGIAAVGGSGSFVQALDEGLKQVDALIVALQEGIARYRATDEENAANLREP